MADNMLTYRCIRKLNSILNQLAEKTSVEKEVYKVTKEAKERVKKIGGGYNGTTKEYKDIVLSYWEKYGVKPERCWYDLYCNGKEQYDPRFIPDSIWFSCILPYFNDMEMKAAYIDKGMLNRILVDVKKPETIVKKIADYYYNGDLDQLITRQEAEQICEQEEHLIIKPYRGTKGKGIVFYDRDRINDESIHSIFDEFTTGFVAQRIVKQHPDLEKLNSSSLNTVRVLSFHFQNEVHILSSQLRIGGENARVDNVSSGGYACEIKPDGWLYEKAVNRQSKWIYETKAGFKFKDIHIPNYPGIVETVKRLHCELPYFNIIGWDFAVGEDSTPILIEFNVRPAQNQIGGQKPTFGSLTDRVLEDVFIKKTLKDAFKR